MAKVQGQSGKRNYHWRWVWGWFLTLGLATPLWGNEKPFVVVIGIDGLGGAYLEKAYQDSRGIRIKTPHLDYLKAQGSYTHQMQNVLPTDSSPNWMSMIAGASPAQHGVFSNNWKRGDSQPTPTMFGVYKAAFSEEEVAVFHQWKDFARLLGHQEARVIQYAPTEDQTIDLALNYMRRERPHLTFIHLDHVDGAGHGSSWGSSHYYSAVEKADQLVGKVIQELKALGIWEKTYLLISSDHGGITSHGNDNYLTRSIPFFITGPGIRPNYQLEKEMRIFDIAATVTYLFQLPQPRSWVGRPLVEVFQSHREEVGVPGQMIEYAVTRDYEWVYDDKGSGALMDLSLWRARLPAGYIRLGDVPQRGHQAPAQGTFIFKDHPIIFKRPLGYEYMASDRGSGGKNDVVFWRPIPPKNYLCLGDIAHLGYSKIPSPDLVRCVHQKYVQKLKGRQYWTNHGSRAVDKVALWTVEGGMESREGKISLQNFFTRADWRDPGLNIYRTLHPQFLRPEERP